MSSNSSTTSGPTPPYFTSVIKSKIPVRSDFHGDKSFDPASPHRELYAESKSAAVLEELEKATFQENLESLRALKTELNETDWMFPQDS